jgi:fatty acid desaturase
MQITESINAAHLALLKQEIRGQGFEEAPAGRALAELALHFAVSLGGLAVCVAVESWALKAAALLVSTLGSLGITTNTHTSSHYATTRRRWCNRALVYLGYTVYYGMSAHYWSNSHVVVHHPAPNVIGVDDDADLSPWFALNNNEFKFSAGPSRLFYRVQWLVVPFALAFNVFNVQFLSWKFLARKLADARQRKPAHWLDLGLILLHWCLWILIPACFFPAAEVLALYAARTGLVGYAAFCAFAPAHYPAEAVYVEKGNYKSVFILAQTETTVNFRAGLIGRLLCSGVDYQIEHHLFPGVSHVHYPRLSRFVEKFCREHGYQYRTLGWGEAIWKSLKTFYRPKKVLSATECFRGPANTSLATLDS